MVLNIHQGDIGQSKNLRTVGSNKTEILVVYNLVEANILYKHEFKCILNL